MTVYNFNLGIGWASSGVEYAQKYRADILKKLGQPAKFIFTDAILRDNIENLTKNIGFDDEDVIWLYQYFTDMNVAPNTYEAKEFEKTIALKERNGSVKEVNKDVLRYSFPDEEQFVTVYLKSGNGSLVQRAEYVSRGCLIRKDYFTSQKICSEYYTPKDNKAYLYRRVFFNSDGTVAFEELIDGDNKNTIYRFSDKILYNKEELIEYFITKLNLTENDVVILDRSTSIGQVVFRNHGKAKLGIVIHADHFNENMTSDNSILWNNYYEYQFTNADEVDFFITATDKQKEILLEQFKKYDNKAPRIVTIPVGGIDKLKKYARRKAYSLVTASRLAKEKHVDWLVKAVVGAHKLNSKITLDIYGEGGEKGILEKLIQANNAGSYIKLKGHQELDKVYRKYEAYISASTSEGFGLTLMEAVGSGLAMIGFDVRYGNQTFIKDKINGELIDFDKEKDIKNADKKLEKAIVELFEQDSLKKMHDESYNIASEYLMENVANKWNDLLKELQDD